jgi:hypothetical protein
MKHKNTKSPQKRTVPSDKLKVIFFMLMATLGVKGFADPVWATIIDMDLTGSFYQYFIDKTGNGIEDGVVQVSSESFVAPLFRRYLQVSGRVLYENEGRNDFNIRGGQLLRIELPDGRIIKVNDFAGQYMEYNHAREYEARQGHSQVPGGKHGDSSVKTILANAPLAVVSQFRRFGQG